jgi:hypothetical protein
LKIERALAKRKPRFACYPIGNINASAHLPHHDGLRIAVFGGGWIFSKDNSTMQSQNAGLQSKPGFRHTLANRHTVAIPAKPMQINSMVAGTGTGTGGSPPD